jgi:hypothetical protein
VATQYVANCAPLGEISITAFYAPRTPNHPPGLISYVLYQLFDDQVRFSVVA